MTSWLNSLSGYLIIRVIPLLALLIGLLAGIASYFSHIILTEILHNQHQELAERFEQNVQATLKGVEDQMLAVAQNDLIINGLIDAQEREKYIPTFIRSWKVSGLLNSRVALLDYKGRLVSSNTQEDFLSTIKSNWKKRVFDEEANFSLLDASGLSMIVPVRYQYGIEGAVALVIPNNELGALFSYEVVDYYVKFADANNQIILDTYQQQSDIPLNTKSDQWFVHQYSSSLGKIFTAQHYEQAFASFQQANSILLLSAFLILLVSGLVIILAARQTALTVSSLSESINMITKTGELNARIKEKSQPTELKNLADEFNGMLDALQESTTSKKRMYEIVDSIGEFLLVVNNQFEVTLINRSLSQFLLDLGVTKGNEVEKLFGQEEKLFLGRWIDSWNQKYSVDDNEFVIQWDRADYHSGETKNTGFIFVGKDVTESIHKEEELRLAKNQAERSSQVKSEFLANMSHEIRTPMNAIIGMNDLILSTELESRQLGYVKKSQKAAKNLLGLLNDILDFSKMEAGKLDIEVIPFDVYEVLESLADIVGVRMQEKEINAYVEEDESMPRGLMGDPLRLNQVLINLIGNALKFTDHGHVAISVFCHNQSHERVELEFRVTDTGIGIHPNTLNDLFSPFTQADGSTTRKFGGTGLGLSISKMLVELMGGEITAQSELGAGSCFSVLIPFQLDPNSKSFNPSAPESKVWLKIADRRTVQGMKKILTQLHITALESHEDAALLNNQDHVFIDLQTLSKEHEMLEELKSRGVRVVLFSQRSAECLNDSRIQGLVSDVIQLPITFLTLYRYFSNESLDGEVAQVIDLGSCRILLVDDNMINREIAKELLEQVNATIDEAENGVEAYEKACSNEYDIVLMDIQMPLMDGYEASSQIGQQLGERAPKIIAMTAKAMDEDRDKAQACGMVGYISKPFDKQQLYQTVHSTWRS